MLTALQRKPQRITITVPHRTLENLIERSTQEGRSLSNLAAYLLERSLNASSLPSP